MPNVKNQDIIYRIQEIVEQVINKRNAILYEKYEHAQRWVPALVEVNNCPKLTAKVTVKNDLPCAFIDTNHALALACAEAVKVHFPSIVTTFLISI